MYQPRNLPQRSNKEFYREIYIGKRQKVEKEWCKKGHWKEMDKPCEVCTYGK